MTDSVALVHSRVPVGNSCLWLGSFITATGRVGEKIQEQLVDKRKSVGTCLKLEGIGQSPLSSHKNFPNGPTQAHFRVIQGRTRSLRATLVL